MGIFGDKRLKLGVWGLGRGRSFIESARALNIDVMAGCDFHDNMLTAFREICPEAVLTKDEDEFLAMDMDAVIVSTYCPNHARDTIKALKAGKHVLCEVTAFFTPAQGVELVEAVEASGLVYNLAENYPFSKENMYLTKLYREGFFGEMAYAEFDYVHGGSNPSAKYPDGTPIQPGNRLHHWRGYLNYHYYCTHSLGPVMIATGLRPEKVTAFPEDVQNMGCVHGKGRNVDGIMPNLGAFAPSLIRMSNGSIVRNLMGGTTADSFGRRFFGTKASAWIDKEMTLKLGANGSALDLTVKPEWEDMGEIAEAAGHGGGDFWELYYFARQIFTGEKAPLDIYSSADVTLAGIQAVRSAVHEGEPMEVPDFRDKAVRDRYRNDHWQAKHLDPEGIFPENQDIHITGDFTTVCRDMIPLIKLVRCALDGMKVYRFVPPEQKIIVVEQVRELREKLPEVAACYQRMRKIADAYPESMGGEAMLEKLDLGEESLILDTAKISGILNDFLLNQA